MRRGHVLMDVVGLAQVEELVQTLLSLEQGVVDDVLHESGHEVILHNWVLVSGALPSQPHQQRPDNIDLGELLLGLEVVLRLVVPVVYEADVVIQWVCAVEEALQRLLLQLLGQEEPLPVVLLRLQVLFGRCLSNPLALGDLLVLLLGEVFCGDDAACLGLHLRLLLLLRWCLFFFCGWWWWLLDGECHTLCVRQHSEVVDENARVLVQTLDGVEDGDVLALGVRVVLRHAHHAVLYKELGLCVRHRDLVELQDLRVLPEVVVAVDAEPLAVQEVHFRVLYASAAVDHLEERPLRVALCAEQSIDLLDLDRYVDARLDHGTVQEYIDVLERLVDVLERLSLGLAAV